MIISRFGDTWAGAYVLPSAMMDDDWSSQRPVVSARVGGLDGEFDVFGDSPFPIAPITVKKSAIVTATTWAGVETALEALRDATIALGETKLWGLMRDGTHRWAWAKCTRCAPTDKVGQILHCPVELEFYLPEGLWYSEDQHTQTSDGTAAFYSENVSVVNAGNVPAAVRVGVTVSVANLLEFGVASPACGWSFAGIVAAATGEKLIVDAAAYSALNNGADCHDDLTITYPGRLWLYALPGSNVFTVWASQVAGGSSSTTLKWYDTWVM